MYKNILKRLKKLESESEDGTVSINVLSKELKEKVINDEINIQEKFIREINNSFYEADPEKIRKVLKSCFEELRMNCLKDNVMHMDIIYLFTDPENIDWIRVAEIVQDEF